MTSSTFFVGQIVEREIDGIWFPGKIERIEDGREMYFNIRYLDDSKLEENVPFDDIRQQCVTQGESRRNPPSDSESKCLLQKPLRGLVEDDSEERATHVPTVIVHSNIDEGDAICLKGAENKLGAGSGLKGLRYLRK